MLIIKHTLRRAEGLAASDQLPARIVDAAVHCWFFGELQARSAGRSDGLVEEPLPRRMRSGFEILAHLGEGAASVSLPEIRRREAEFAAESVGEVTVAG